MHRLSAGLDKNGRRQFQSKFRVGSTEAQHTRTGESMREDPETFRDFHHGGAQTLTLSAYFIIGCTTALAVCIFHHKLSTR